MKIISEKDLRHICAGSDNSYDSGNNSGESARRAYDAAAKKAKELVEKVKDWLAE